MPFWRIDLACTLSGRTMTGQYATLFFIFKGKMIVFLNINVKSPCYELKIHIYDVAFLELYLSDKNKQPGVNAIHCYATHNGCQGRQSRLEAGSNGVSRTGGKNIH